MPTVTLSYHQKVQPVRREEKSPRFLSPREKLVRKAPGGEEAEQNKASVAQPGRKVSGKLGRGLAQGLSPGRAWLCLHMRWVAVRVRWLGPHGDSV